MKAFAQDIHISRARSLGRRPTWGVSVAAGPVHPGNTRGRNLLAFIAVAVAPAAPVAAAETVSPLPILLWIAAPLLLAAASVIVAYAIGFALRQLRRLLNPGSGTLRRGLADADRQLPPEPSPR